LDWFNDVQLQINTNQNDIHLQTNLQDLKNLHLQIDTNKSNFMCKPSYKSWKTSFTNQHKSKQSSYANKVTKATNVHLQIEHTLKQKSMCKYRVYMRTLKPINWKEFELEHKKFSIKNKIKSLFIYFDQFIKSIFLLIPPIKN
jgi:hypothetical protein